MLSLTETWHMRIEEDKSLQTGELSGIHGQLTHSWHSVTQQLNSWGWAAEQLTAGENLVCVQESRQLSQGECEKLRPGVLQQDLLVVRGELLEWWNVSGPLEVHKKQLKNKWINSIRSFFHQIPLQQFLEHLPDQQCCYCCCLELLMMLVE